MIRVIARIEIQNGRAVKGRQCEGVRVIGDPADLAARYYDAGVDELFLQDVGASLYGDEPDYATVEAVASRVFVPLVVAGGVSTVAHVERILGLGVERVAINTAAVYNGMLLTHLAARFGASSLSLLVEAKREPDRTYGCRVLGGRETSGVDVATHARRCAGMFTDLIVCSVDRDGTGDGPDLDLIAAVRPSVACGGIRTARHAVAAVQAGAQAVAIASGLHTRETSLTAIRDALQSFGYEVRRP